MNEKKVNQEIAARRSIPASPHMRRDILGRELAVYRGRSFGCSGSVTLLLAGLAALLPLVYSLWLVEFAYTQYGSVAANTWGRSWLTISALAAACFLLLAFYRLYLFQRCVALHTNGIRLRLGFLLTRSFTWEQIQGINSGIIQDRFLHLPIRTYHQAILIPYKGKLMTLRAPMEDLPELIQQIKRNLYSRRLPKERYRFQVEELVDFGPLAINKTGLQCKQDKTVGELLIPWKNIRMIDIQAGYLIIQMAADQSARIPISKITNFEILMEIIQQEVKV